MMEYKFGRAANVCSACSTPFEEGQRFVSALSDTAVEALAPERDEEDSRFVRLDVCETCWLQQPRESLFSWWLNHKEIRPPKPPTADPEFLWLLLGQTLPHHDPEREEQQRNPLAVHLGYLAALGLLRLKHVHLGRHRREGARAYQSFVPRESRQREIVVLDPEPNDVALAIVEQKLCDLAEAVRSGTDYAVWMQRHTESLPTELSLTKSKKRKRKKKARARNITGI